MGARLRPRGELLAAISNAIVGIHKEHYGKGPTKARTTLADDLVVCVLEEPFTRAERTLIAVGRLAEVRGVRIAFQSELREVFTAAVERLMGRRVVAFVSEVHVDPDLAIELFVLDRDNGSPDRGAVAPRAG